MRTAPSGRGKTKGGDEGGRVVPLRRRGRHCPICGKPAAERTRPFCSQRCADLDLGRWLQGHYRIPTEEPVVDEDDDAPGDGEP